MYISKTLFLNLIRCPLFVKLKQIKKGFSSEYDSFKEEIKEELKQVISDLGEEDITNEYLDAMLPHYKEVELIAAKHVVSKYGKAIYSSETSLQKSFERKINDNIFVCYLDIYNETENHINVFEVKASTSNKFLDLGAKKQGEKISIFAEKNGIYYLKEELKINDLDEKKYMQNRNKLKDVYHSCGRYVYDLAFQRYIIEGREDKKNKFFLAVLNSNYVFDGKYKDGKPNYDFKNAISLFDLTKITQEMKELIEDDIRKIEKYIENPVSYFQIGKYCGFKKTFECEFKENCFTFLKNNHPISGYMNAHNGFKSGDDKITLYEAINNGIKSMEDMKDEYLNRFKNIIQKKTIIEDKPYINKLKIREGIKQIKYPIYHLDFESFPSPLPRFKGEKCYNQSVFQYSLHIEDKDGVCDKHYEFLAKDLLDHRKELVISMIENIKPGGTVLVYNETFEKSRINEFMNFFPEYKDRLIEINNKVFDLMHLVKGNKKMYEKIGCNDDLFNYYHKNQNGSFSIKAILPVFSNMSYKDLKVKNGLEAIVAYLKLGRKYDNLLYKDMLKYCEQDTYSMFLILKKLREII